MPKSICIIRLSALGDVLMLVPLIRALQRAYPKAEITWIISKPAYDLVKDIEAIDFVVIPKPKRFRDYLSFKRQMKDQHFDVLLATQASLRANLLIACVKAKVKIGYDKLRANDGQRFFTNKSIEPGKDHTLEGFLKFAKALNIDDLDVRFDIPILPAEMDWVSALNIGSKRPLVLVNPAASKPERSWQAHQYAELIKYLKAKKHAQVFLTGGPTPADDELSKAINQLISVDRNLVGQTKPKQLLALIKTADLMICPDTGPSHMASAVSTPVIALHAVTNPNISGPYGSLDRVINCYPEALSQFKNKTPEQVSWGTQVHDTRAMALVGLDAVLKRVDEFLNDINSSKTNFDR